MRLSALFPRWAAAPQLRLHRRRPQSDPDPSSDPQTTNTAPTKATNSPVQQTTVVEKTVTADQPKQTTAPKATPKNDPTTAAAKDDPTPTPKQQSNTPKAQSTQVQPSSNRPATTVLPNTPTGPTVIEITSTPPELEGVPTDAPIPNTTGPEQAPSEPTKSANTSKSDAGGGFTGIKGKEIATGVGIAFGVAIGFAILIVGIIMFRRRRRRRQARENQNLDDDMSEINLRGERRFPLEIDDPVYDPVSPPATRGAASGTNSSGVYREETEHYEVIAPALPMAPAIAITAPEKSEPPNLATQSASLAPWDEEEKKFAPQAQSQYVAYRPGANSSPAPAPARNAFAQQYGGGYGGGGFGGGGGGGGYPSQERFYNQGMNQSTTRGNGYRGVHVAEGGQGSF